MTSAAPSYDISNSMGAPDRHRRARQFLIGEHTGQFAWIVAACLALAHVSGPFVSPALRAHSALAESFGGGLAVAQVFLNLIPELEVAHEYHGDQVHFLILASVLAIFAVEIHILGPYRLTNEGEEADPQREARAFWFHVGLSWVYSWLIVFALPASIVNNFMFALFASLAIGLHVIYKNHVLHTHHRSLFQSRGRYVLMTAPLIGWLAHVQTGVSEALFDVFLAILAGYLIQSVFREELPSYDKARFVWLAAGTLVFLALELIIP